MALLESVCIKEKNSNKTIHIGQVDLIQTGIPNDVHCDGGLLQISILPKEIIEKNNKNFKPGDYGENFVVKDLDYKNVKVGQNLIIGDGKLLITQIGANNGGTECNNEIHKNFIFCKVLVSGIITEGDTVYVE